jgi:hypothetical protein
MQNYQLKLIKNVRLCLVLLCLTALVASLTGCASVKPVEIITVAQPRTPLALTDPEPLQVAPVKWVVITPDNADSVFKQLAAKGQSLVLFALTDDGYQQLAVTMSEVRNFIATQRAIVIKYKEYYEADSIK